MMKCLLNFLVLLALQGEAVAQGADTNRINTLLNKAVAISTGIEQSDSVEILAKEALELSEPIKFDKGTRRAWSILADYYFLKGKLSLSLSYLLKNEERAIANADTVGLFAILRSEAGLYNRIGDVNMLRATIMRRQYILDNNGIKGLKDTSYPVISQYNNLAHYYMNRQVNMPDSSAYYYRKMMLLGRNTERANLWGQLSNGGLGNYFLEKKSYDSAVWYLKNGMALALEGKRIDNYYGYMASLASAYQQSGQADSAFKYAYYLQQNANRFGYNSILASSSSILAKLFRAQKKYDSAVKYMTLESGYKDSITGVEALNNIQFLTNDYKMKTLERQKEKEQAVNDYKARVKNYMYAGGIVLLLMVIAAMYRVNKQRTRSKQAIEQAYNDLKVTQAQLVQSEKMASLGELTAGIAHEIQNPLNFVNNFSEINMELIEELRTERSVIKEEEINGLLRDIFDNNEKINHHGRRADSIVKGMLQHSRASSGQKEPTNINALCDEYLRLSYHGLRAKDKSFNAELKTDFDESVGTIQIVPQDMGRVIMNIITNAFYAVNEKKKTAGSDYNPTVSVSTSPIRPPEGGGVLIKITDNGPGIPQNIIDKIFQPFFTTKPTGKGTGLGLSLSYDIIKAHGGNLAVETREGEYASFVITLPA